MALMTADGKVTAIHQWEKINTMPSQARYHLPNGFNTCKIQICACRGRMRSRATAWDTLPLSQPVPL